MNTEVIKEIVVIFAIALIFGYIAVKLKQTPVIGYLLGGAILSLPILSKLINFSLSENFAQIGVALMLFTSGLEFSISRILSLKKSIIIGTFFQLILFIVISRILYRLIGFDSKDSFFLAAAFSNSSTMVVIDVFEKNLKLNFQKDDVVGWLFVQDIAMIVIGVLVSSFGLTQNFSFLSMFFAGAKSVFIIAVLIFLGRTVIPKVFETVAKLNSFEILLILSFVFCLAFAFFAEKIGLSFTIGAFISGIMISESFVNHEIFSEVKPLREVFSVIFYVSIGALIPISFVINNFFQVLIVLLLLFVVKVCITFFIILAFDKQIKSAFLISLAIFQSGEFAFVFAQQVFDKNWISQNIYSMIIVVTIISLIITPIVINNADQVFCGIRDFVRKKNYGIYRKIFINFDKEINQEKIGLNNHVIICGFGRVGNYIGKMLEKVGIKYIVIDSSTEIVDYCKQRGINIIFGDASTTEILEQAFIRSAKAIAIVLPKESDLKKIVANVKKLNSNIKILVRSHFPEESIKLHEEGVNAIVEPEFEASLSLSKKLLAFYGIVDLNIAKYLKKSRRKMKKKIEKSIPIRTKIYQD